MILFRASITRRHTKKTTRPGTYRRGRPGNRDDRPSLCYSGARTNTFGSSELVREAPPSSVLTPKEMPTFVGLLGDLKLQIDGYGANMRRIASNSTELSTRFHDLVREQRIGTQTQDRVIKELSANIEALKENVHRQGILIMRLEQRLEAATGRG